ncbi:hypothetical protein HY227_00520 [Candidatus Wolfebacteria bacterium]|nr:hypothetical protein [Candidatus Wolfebacteria bacterium]
MRKIKYILLVGSFLSIFVAPVFVSAATVEELQGQVSTLQAQINSLLARIQAMQGQGGGGETIGEGETTSTATFDIKISPKADVDPSTGAFLLLENKKYKFTGEVRHGYKKQPVYLYVKRPDETLMYNYYYAGKTNSAGNLTKTTKKIKITGGQDGVYSAWVVVGPAIPDDLRGSWISNPIKFSIARETISTSTPHVTIFSTPAAGGPNGDSVTIKPGDMINITAVPSGITGQEGADYQKAFFFDSIFNNSCTNTDWVMTCIAGQTGMSKFYVEIYKSGNTYRSNTIYVTVQSTTTTSFNVLLPNGLETFSDGQFMPHKVDIKSQKTGTIKIYIAEKPSLSEWTGGKYYFIASSGGFIPSLSFPPYVYEGGLTINLNLMSPITPGKYYLLALWGSNDGTENFADFSDAPFSIVAAGTSTPITIVTPNGGEKWQLGSTHTIKWTPYDPVGGINPASNMTAYLEKAGTRGNFVTVGKIVECGKASIHWEGNLDSCGSNNFPEPGKYYIKVVNNLTGVWDRSDKPFSLMARDSVKVDLKINNSNGPIVVSTGGDDFTASWKSNVQACNIYNDTTGERFENLSPSGSKQIKILPNNEWYSKSVIIWCTATTPVEGVALDKVEISPSNSSITVVSPNGGEAVYLAPSSIPVRWKAFANLEKISIGLYKNDASYLWIAKDLPANNQLEGSYNWAPSSIKTADLNKNIFKIYALGYKVGGGTVEDKSDAPFSISPNPTPTSTPLIVISYPQGEELFPIASGFNIKWQTSQIPATNEVSIGIRNIVTNSDYFIGTSLNDGAEPISLPVGAPVGRYKLFVKSLVNGVSIHGWSNEFKIVDTSTSSITIISPNGGEKWVKGQQNNIKWKSVNYSGPFDIILEECTTGTCPGSFIVRNVQNEMDGGFYYSWDTKSLLPGGGLADIVDIGKYKIRVIKSAGSSISDISDGTFSITTAEIGTTSLTTNQMANALESMKALLLNITEALKNR